MYILSCFISALNCYSGWLCLVISALNPFHYSHPSLFPIQTSHHEPETCLSLCHGGNFENVNGGKGWTGLDTNVCFFFFLFFIIADFLHQDGVSLKCKWSCASLYSLRIQPERSRSQNNSYFFLQTKRCVFEWWQSLEARLSLYAILSRMWGVG